MLAKVGIQQQDFGDRQKRDGEVSGGVLSGTTASDGPYSIDVSVTDPNHADKTVNRVSLKGKVYSALRISAWIF